MSFSDQLSESVGEQARADGGAQERVEGRGFPLWPINRREFVAGAGVASVLAGAGLASSRPQIVRRGRGIAVIFTGCPDWEILPEMFSDAGILPMAIDGDNDKLELSLSRASFRGTSLSPDFEAQIGLEGDTWTIWIKFGAIQRIVPVSLAGWMRSQTASAVDASDRGASDLVCEGAARISSFTIGGGAAWHIQLSAARIGFRADFSGRITTSGQNDLVFEAGDRNGRGFLARSSRVDFALSDAIEDFTAFAGRHSRPQSTPDVQTPNTWIELSSVHMEDGFVGVGHVAPYLKVEALFDRPTVTVRAFERGHSIFSGADCFVRVHARDGALVVRADGAGVGGARIQLTQPAFESLQLTMNEDVFVHGKIAKGFQGIEADRFAFEIESSGDQGIAQTFGRRALKSLSISTTLRAIHVPLDRGAVADGYVGPTSCEILFQGQLDQPRLRLAHPKTHALVWIGRDASALEMPLTHTKLRVSRCRDLFDLNFQFQNYALSCGQNGTSIRSFKITGDTPVLAVEFPPQHLFEEAFLPPPDPVNDPKVDWSPDVAPPLGDMRKPLGQRARAWLSQPSRLVFKDSSVNASGWGKDKPLTVDYLTEWKDLGLIVNKRAQRKDISLSKQLELPGLNLTPDMSPAAALQSVAEFNQWSFDPFETAIEPAFRLIVSPDDKAQWAVPPPLPSDGDPVEVWAARLANPTETAVRALWARRMSATVDPSTNNLVLATDSCTLFAGSTNDQDRMELAAMSSFYGMVALRRLSAVVTPSGEILVDDPSSMVSRPGKVDGRDFKCLQGDFNLGIVSPKPFDQFSLSLSRSATLDALWQGQPPGSPGQSPSHVPYRNVLARAFNVELYRHRIQDGRDVLVEVFYKGFLLPFGHRVSWLKITQREFHPHEGTDKKNPVAYLVQHNYVVCRKPIKAFPAYNHPFNANDCPPRSVELLTTLTPDLAAPEGLPSGLSLPDDPAPVGGEGAPMPEPSCATANKPMPYHVVWPQYLYPKDPNQKEIFFEFRVDGDKTPARMPMVYISNDAAHDAKMMQAVVTWYNTLLPDDYLSTATHEGATRRYAAEKTGGECSFTTTSWKMKLRGVINHDSSGTAQETFGMDALMEGADQPPAYPYVDIANVSIEPVNRLTGQRNLPVEVSYSPRYTLNAFDPARNPAELYLDVLGTPKIVGSDIQNDPIYLDARSDGKSTGGVAKPNALLSVMSRSKGPIGGRGLSAPQSITSGVANVPVEADNPPYANALAGRFDPIEYFGAALGEAKLLGIIALKDILRAVAISEAPQLTENVMYQVHNAEEKISAGIRKALNGLLDNISADFIQNEIIAKLDSPSGTLDQIYPKLHQALKTLSEFLKGLRARYPSDLDDASLSKWVTLATEGVKDVQRVLSELRSVASDPMPANVRDEIDKLSTAWQGVKAITKQGSVVNLLNSLMGVSGETSLFDPLCASTVQSGLFEFVFGALEFPGSDAPVFKPSSDPGTSVSTFPLPPPTSATDTSVLGHGNIGEAAFRALLQGAADSLPRIQEALFAPTIGEPIVNALNAVRILGKSQLKDASIVVAWSRSALTDLVMDQLRLGVVGATTPATTIAAHGIVEIVENAWITAARQPKFQIDPKDPKKWNAKDLVGAFETQCSGTTAQILDQVRLIYEGVAADTYKTAIRGLSKEIEVAQTTEKTQRDYAQAFLDKSDYVNFYGATAKADERKTYIGHVAQPGAAATGLIALRDILQNTDSGNETSFSFDRSDAAGKLNDALKSAASALIEDAANATLDALLEYVAPQAAEIAANVNRIMSSAIDYLQSARLAVQRNVQAKLDLVCGDVTQLSAFAQMVGTVAAGAAASTLDDVHDALDKFSTELTTVRAGLAKFPGLTGDPDVARQNANARLSVMATTTQRLIGHVEELQRIALAMKPANWPPPHPCDADLAAFLRPVSLAIQLRGKAVRAISAVSNDLNAAIEAETLMSGLPSEAKAGEKLPRLLLPILLHVTAIPFYAGRPAGIDQFLNDRPELKTLLSDDNSNAFEDIVTAAIPLQNNLQSLPASLTIAQIVEQVSEFTIVRERKFAAALLQVCLPQANFLQPLSATAATAVTGVAQTLAEITDAVDDGVSGIQALLEAPENSTLASIFSKSIKDDLNALKTALDADKTNLGQLITDLGNIPSDPTKPLPALDNYTKVQSDVSTLQTSWRSGGPAAIQAITRIESIVSAVAAGNIRALIDVDGIQKKLEQSIEDLIPAQVDLTYDFDAALPDFPPGDPIFSINTDDSFYDHTKSDLVISTHVSQNLLTGVRKIEAHGSIQPFNIHLLGDALDLVTINFSGARFDLTPDGSTKFHADVAGLEIGSALQFLSAIQELIGGIEGGDDEEGDDDGGDDEKDSANGFYHHFRLSPPEFEVGYGYSAPLLQLGGLSLQNIGFSVSAILPFDDRQALFRFTFATAEKPFLISMPPYGGGGFVGIYANARGVIGFEVQMEFGAVVAFQFGPLSGQGRITAGIYMLSYDGGERRLEGFVHAVGEAHIACFGLSVLLEIRTIQIGSSMEGSATYAFSFSVGMFSVSYSVTAHVSQQGGASGSKKSAQLESPLRSFAALTGIETCSTPPSAKYFIRNVAPSKTSAWSEYSDNIDI